MATEMFERKDTEGDVLFALYDLVVCTTGGPCMVITEFVGQDKATCVWFTETGIPFTKVFPLAILDHWEDDA